jgi:hypothetical protein
MNNHYQTKYLKYRAKYNTILNGGQPRESNGNYNPSPIAEPDHSSSVRIKLKVYVNNQFEGEGSVMVNGYPGDRPTTSTLYSSYNICDLVGVPKHLAYMLEKYTKKPLPSKRLSKGHILTEGNTYYAYYKSMKPTHPEEPPPDYIPPPTPNLDHLSLTQRAMHQAKVLKAKRSGTIPPPIHQVSVRTGTSSTTLANARATAQAATRARQQQRAEIIRQRHASRTTR